MGKTIALKCVLCPEYSYNSPAGNERRIELPVGMWFINEYKDNLIEIGEVLPFYGQKNHTVYDLVKESEVTIIKDALDVDYTDCNVVSLSTIEHIGKGDYGHAAESGKAARVYDKIKKEAKNYLISFPIGYNRELEKHLTDNNEKYIIMKRDEHNMWTTAVGQTLADFEYNSPYHAGNAVVFLTNLDIEFTFGV